jgi:hypothetical protein
MISQENSNGTGIRTSTLSQTQNSACQRLMTSRKSVEKPRYTERLPHCLAPQAMQTRGLRWNISAMGSYVDLELPCGLLLAGINGQRYLSIAATIEPCVSELALEELDRGLERAFGCP